MALNFANIIAKYMVVWPIDQSKFCPKQKIHKIFQIAQENN